MNEEEESLIFFESIVYKHRTKGKGKNPHLSLHILPIIVDIL